MQQAESTMKCRSVWLCCFPLLPASQGPDAVALWNSLSQHIWGVSWQRQPCPGLRLPGPSAGTLTHLASAPSGLTAHRRRPTPRGSPPPVSLAPRDSAHCQLCPFRHSQPSRLCPHCVPAHMSSSLKQSSPLSRQGHPAGVSSQGVPSSYSVTLR